jgi:hypothetical protein
MRKYDLIISVAGWEDRFSAGLCRDMNRVSASRILLFVFNEYSQITVEKRDVVEKEALSLKVKYEEVNVEREPLELWKMIQESFSESLRGKSVLLNLSTMPREVIWWTCLRLEALECRISYSYYKPDRYASWLTLDTRQPRLLYQLSGLSSLGRPTCLLLLTGFDVDRAMHIIEYFEPVRVILGIQVGNQFENEARNIQKIRVLQERRREVLSFQLDAMSEDRGFAAMESAILQIHSDYNIIGASLGPKVSAIALYKLQRKYREIALAYAPSSQFNTEYSIGIGDMLEGNLSE